MTGGSPLSAAASAYHIGLVAAPQDTYSAAADRLPSDTV